MYCNQPPNLELSKARRVTIFVFCIIESVLFAGTVFGWPQLVHVLKVEGLYSDLCENHDATPSSSYSTANASYTPPFSAPASSTPLSAFHTPLSGNSVPPAPTPPHIPSSSLSAPSLRPLSASASIIPSPVVFPSTLSTSAQLSPSSAPLLPPTIANDSSSASPVYAHTPAISSTASPPPDLSSSEGIVSELPDDDAVESCPAQDARFALIFTLTVGCYSVPGVLVGYLLHHAGLRITRILAGTLVTMSFLFLSVATKEHPDYLYPAMIMMALGGNQLRMSTMQLGDLFPKQRSTAITLLSGMYAASASLFLLFQYTAMAGVARAQVCWVLAGVSLLSIIFSFIMPVHHIPVKDTYTHPADEDRSRTPLSSSFWSLSSLLHQYWFFVGLFSVNIYQQTYNVWVNLSSSSEEEVALYSMLYSFSNFFTVFFGPIGGALTDYLVRRARRIPNELSRRVKEVQASFWPLLVTTLATGVMYGCLFSFSSAAVYVSLAAMVISRPCVIAVSTAFVRIRFPADHFNRLLGIHGTLASVLMFLQYPQFIWAGDNYYAAHGFTFVLLVCSLSYPLHLLATPLMRKAVIVRDRLTNESLRPQKTLS